MTTPNDPRASVLGSGIDVLKVPVFCAEKLPMVLPVILNAEAEPEAATTPEHPAWLASWSTAGWSWPTEGRDAITDQKYLLSPAAGIVDKVPAMEELRDFLFRSIQDKNKMFHIHIDKDLPDNFGHLLIY